MTKRDNGIDLPTAINNSLFRYLGPAVINNDKNYCGLKCFDFGRRRTRKL